MRDVGALVVVRRATAEARGEPQARVGLAPETGCSATSTEGPWARSVDLHGVEHVLLTKLELGSAVDAGDPPHRGRASVACSPRDGTGEVAYFKQGPGGGDGGAD